MGRHNKTDNWKGEDNDLHNPFHGELIGWIWMDRALTKEEVVKTFERRPKKCVDGVQNNRKDKPDP